MLNYVQRNFKLYKDDFYLAELLIFILAKTDHEIDTAVSSLPIILFISNQSRFMIQ